jgi:hypothetical protein
LKAFFALTLLHYQKWAQTRYTAPRVSHSPYVKLPFISLHQRGSGGGEFFQLVGTDFGILEVE